MKVLLIGINAKYIHSSLGCWYLWSSCRDYFDNIEVMEFSINDNLDDVLGNVYFKKCNVVAFSCYIWNIEYVLKIANNLKKIAPDIKIVLGGPEVSYNPEQVLVDNAYIDYIVSGEGETSFKQLLQYIKGKDTNITNANTGGINTRNANTRGINTRDTNTDIGNVNTKDMNAKKLKIENINGVAYKEKGKIVSNKNVVLIEELDNIPTPYTEKMFEEIKDKIIYYESSRGCPFSCSYCISSTFKGVRYFSIDRVKKELKMFLDAGIKLIKFVDRTFNCNKKRAMEIFKFVIENSVDTCFHFEAAGDLFDDDMIALLSEAPSGIIQFEIGVQSTNNQTLNEVNRKTDIEKVFHYTRKLMDLKNIHIHLDLIAGLPYEDYNSFKNSFNEVYNLKPHKLQLGFLKMLKGSGIHKNLKKHCYLYRDYPPYEVLANSVITFEALIKLKKIEKMVERYYNSRRFCKSLEYIINNFFDSAFDFYEKLSLFYEKEGFFMRSISSRELYTILLHFIDNLSTNIDTNTDTNTDINTNIDTNIDINKGAIHELLRFDFLASHRTSNLPDGIEKVRVSRLKERIFEFLKDEENIEKYIPEYLNEPVKKIIRYVRFEPFSLDVMENLAIENIQLKENPIIILFNYNKKDKVSELFEVKKVKLQF